MGVCGKGELWWFSFCFLHLLGGKPKNKRLGGRAQVGLLVHSFPSLLWRGKGWESGEGTNPRKNLRETEAIMAVFPVGRQFPLAPWPPDNGEGR